MPQTAQVRLAISGWYEDLIERLARDLFPRPAKHNLRLPVPVGDSSLGIHRDESVVGTVHDQTGSRLALLQPLFGPLALRNVVEGDSHTVVGKWKSPNGEKTARNALVSVIDFLHGDRLSRSNYLGVGVRKRRLQDGGPDFR